MDKRENIWTIPLAKVGDLVEPHNRNNWEGQIVRIRHAGMDGTDVRWFKGGLAGHTTPWSLASLIPVLEERLDIPPTNEVNDLTTKIEAVRQVKEWYIEADDFEEASLAREYERELLRLRQLATAWA